LRYFEDLDRLGTIEKTQGDMYKSREGKEKGEIFQKKKF